MQVLRDRVQQWSMSAFERSRRLHVGHNFSLEVQMIEGALS